MIKMLLSGACLLTILAADRPAHAAFGQCVQEYIADIGDSASMRWLAIQYGAHPFRPDAYYRGFMESKARIYCLNYS